MLTKRTYLCYYLKYYGALRAIFAMRLRRVIIMATKSFTTDFIFNAKSGKKLVEAIENSKKVNHEIKQKVEDVTGEKSINAIMDAFLKGEPEWR